MGEQPDSAQSSWQPTCSVAMLRLRAFMLKSVREFFDIKGYLEVETPLVSEDIVVDAHLEPFELPEASLTDHRRMFLQTSPEAGMKRLLAAGCGSIFQVTRSFRRGESGPRHNPEFTMLEWYGVNTTWAEQMDFTERLIRHVASCVAERQSEFAVENSSALLATTERSFRRTSYSQAFQRRLNAEVLNAPVSELRRLVQQYVPSVGDVSDISDRDDLLNLLLAECIEPELGKDRPEFLTDYPISQAALAEANAADPHTACRFELYWNGLELCNGYQEMTDSDELQRRDQMQNSSRTVHDVQPLPGAKRMMAAMESGLPQCSGVALGFDRLVMCLTSAQSIAQVIPFPWELSLIHI